MQNKIIFLLLLVLLVSSGHMMPFKLDQKSAQVSLENFPEELIGYWSCNCETDRKAGDGAGVPPAFWIKKSAEGYEVWYTRSSGIIKEISRSENRFTLKYEDEYDGDTVLEIELINERLTINGAQNCEPWGNASGMEKCAVKDY